MHDLHCECQEQLKHVRTERQRAERKMQRLAEALYWAAPAAARLIVQECNDEGGLIIDLPARLDGTMEP